MKMPDKMEEKFHEKMENDISEKAFQKNLDKNLFMTGKMKERCSHCNKIKEITEWYDGKDVVIHECNKCKKERERKKC